jgi:hypothetical protein
MAEDTGTQVQDDLGLGISASPDDHQASLAGGKKEEEGKKEGDAAKTALDPEEQKERTKFGRRLATMEKTLEDRFAKFDENFLSINQILTKLSSPESRAYNPDADLITDEDRKRYRLLRDEEVKSQHAYESDYRKVIDKVKEKDAALHKEIYDEMFANFNMKPFGNPEADARLNYAEAKASLMAKKNAEAEKKGIGRKGPPTGLGIGSRMAAEGEEEVTLSPDAEAYVKTMGKDKDFVKRALSAK